MAPPALPPELDGCRRRHELSGISLYPQYSTTTSLMRTRLRECSETSRGHGPWCGYAFDPTVSRLAGRSAVWEQHCRGEKLVFSFHGIPQRLAVPAIRIRIAAKPAHATPKRELPTMPGS